MVSSGWQRGPACSRCSASPSPVHRFQWSACLCAEACGAGPGSEYGDLGEGRVTSRNLLLRRGPHKPAEAEEEAEEEADEDDDGYGSDLYGDDDDRARLAAMTDLDREMELFERSEARERRREARRNARLLQQAQRRDQARAGPAPDPAPVSRRAVARARAGVGRATRAAAAAEAEPLPCALAT